MVGQVKYRAKKKTPQQNEALPYQGAAVRHHQDWPSAAMSSSSRALVQPAHQFRRGEVARLQQQHAHRPQRFLPALLARASNRP